VACHISLETLDKGYTFAWDLISIKGMHTKLWAPKATRVPTLGILGLPSGNPGTKFYLGAVPWPGIKYTIKGKVVSSGKSELWGVLCVYVCLWLVRAPKMFKLHINQVVVWFVQVRVNNWCLSFFLVPILGLQHALLHPKCCESGIVPQLLTLPLFSL
jgi:hypothetical protein